MKSYYSKNYYQATKNLEAKEISKGILGSVMRYPNETVFSFSHSNINKRKKLKDEYNTIINSYKEYKINEGILKIKSINNALYEIITEPVIDSVYNLHYMQFKGFEIYKIFQKFNVFIKYCVDNKINLSNLKLSDIYLTKNYELKILSIKYDIELLHKIKKEKFSDTHNNKNTMLYVIGTVMYYLYYNQYPKNNETKFPEPKHFKELLKYCLNINKKFDYNEYINHTFFHPDIIFPNSTKENIKLFSGYTENKPSNASIMSSECEELYFDKKEENYGRFYSIYNSLNKTKILEVKSFEEPKLIKLKTEKNKNLYIIIFEDQIFVLKKNNNNFSVTQEINNRFSKFLELSNGDIAAYYWKNLNIYSRNSEDKLNLKLNLSDIYASILLETDDNYLSITNKEESILYDIKNFKKIKEDKTEDNELYLNEKIKLKIDGSDSIIYHCFFEEEILKIHDKYFCAIKKKDGTFLIGGYKNHIYQLYFDKYGFPEIISDVDTGYGYYEDDMEGDCIYSYNYSRYYSVGYIEECENGDIITISDLDKIKKFWKY